MSSNMQSVPKGLTSGFEKDCYRKAVAVLSEYPLYVRAHVVEMLWEEVLTPGSAAALSDRFCKQYPDGKGDKK